MSRLDRETRDLLRDDPELLEVAQAIARTRPRSLAKAVPVALLASVLVVAAVLGLLSSSSASLHRDGAAGAVAAASGLVTKDPDAGRGVAGPNDSWLSQVGDVTDDQLNHAALQATAIPNGYAASWQPIGPTNVGGRVTDVVVDPANPLTIYIAAAGGGIWKSTDEGAHFTSVWPGANTQTIGALAMGPDGTLWAGTGEANPAGGGMTYFGQGVYKSTDGGATWTNVGLQQSDAIGRIVVNPQNPNEVWVAASGTIYANTSAQRGIYHTLDGGATWQLALAPSNPTTGGIDIALAPGNPNRIYAALWDHHRDPCCRTYGGIGSGLYRSDDDGQTWTLLDNVSGALPTYDTAKTGLVPDASLGRIGIAVAPSDPNRVYVITGTQYGADKGFFVSNDGGTTFTAAGRAGGNSGYSWWFGRIWVDPGNENHLFVADVNLRQSTDGGNTWTNITSVHSDQHGMAWDLSTTNSTSQAAERIYLGNDGGVYHTDTDGLTNASWIHAIYEPWNQSYHIAVAGDTDQRLATGLQDNGSVRTWTAANPLPTDLTQSNSYGGGDGHYVAIDPANHSIYYQCSQNASCGGVQDNANGTQTTLRFGRLTGETRATTDAPLVVDPTNTSVVYVGSNVLDRGTNHGSAFTQISPSDPADLPGLPTATENDPTYANTYATITAIAPGAQNANPAGYANTIYVGTDTGNVWVTNDAGVTWTQLGGTSVSTGQPIGGALPTLWVNSIAVDPTDNNHAIVAFSGFRVGDDTSHLYETTDGGQTWSSISGNLPNAPVENVIFDRPDNLILGATDLGVFFLHDPGDLPIAPTTWQQLGTGLPQTPDMDLKIDGTDTNLFVGTFGRSMYSIALPKDTTPPVSSASLSPAAVNGWYSANPTVTLSALDDANGSGVALTEYSLDGGPEQGYTAPFKVTGDGQHTLQYQSIDFAGNVEAAQTLSFQIDTTPPVVTPPADVTVEATGANGAVATYGTATALDAQDGPLPANCVPASGSLFPRGTTQVLCKATDQAGNVGVASFNVLVKHTAAPIVTPPANALVEATGPSGAVYTYANGTATDIVDGTDPVSCTPASGATFPLGDTKVTCSATDTDGNTGLGYFDVIVQDTTAPKLTLPADQTVEATGPAGAPVSYTATAADLVDGSVTPDCKPASGTTFAFGHTPVTCTATDAHGNVSTGTFDVNVVDTTVPVVTVPADMTLEASGPGGATATWTSSATDIVDGPLTTTCTPPSGSTFPVGHNQVVCSATDAHQNTGSAFFAVNVVDTTPPVVQQHANIVVPATSPAGATVSFTVTASDVVDGTLPATCAPLSGSTFPIGHTTVTCTATDAHGNKSAPSTFDVYVQPATVQIGNLAALILSYRLNPVLTVDFGLRLADIALKVATHHDACGALDDFDQEALDQAMKPNAKLTLAQAGAIVAGANTIASTLACAHANPPYPQAEQDLLTLTGTINGLHLDSGTAGDLRSGVQDVADELFAPTPKTPPHGKPAPAPVCQSLADLSKTIAADAKKRNGLTAAQAATLSAAVAHLSSELGC